MTYTEDDFKIIARRVVDRTNNLIIQLEFLKKDYQAIINGDEFLGRSMPDDAIKNLEYWVNLSVALRGYAEFREE